MTDEHDNRVYEEALAGAAAVHFQRKNMDKAQKIRDRAIDREMEDGEKIVGTLLLLEGFEDDVGMVYIAVHESVYRIQIPNARKYAEEWQTTVLDEARVGLFRFNEKSGVEYQLRLYDG